MCLRVVSICNEKKWAAPEGATWWVTPLVWWATGRDRARVAFQEAGTPNIAATTQTNIKFSFSSKLLRPKRKAMVIKKSIPANRI
jgi:hypothetical protein